MSRRWWLLAAVVVLSLGGTPASGGSGVTVAVFEGRGWGHGVGMAQDGALAMGLGGADLGTILGHFYPGSSLGHVTSGTVPVNVLEPGNGEVVLGFPSGGDVRTPNTEGAQHEGFPVKVAPGGSVVVRSEAGGYRVEVLSGHVAAQSQGSPHPVAFGAAQVDDEPVSQPTIPGEEPPDEGDQPPPSEPVPPPSEPPPPSQPPPSEPSPPEPAGSWSPDPVWALPADYGLIDVPALSTRYRGTVQVTALGGPFRAVNHVALEDYLRGMGEVRDPSWPQASLQAQAVAARTYALWYLAGHAELCDTQRCQVYLGQPAEYPAMDRAVASTAGMVLTYGGGVIQALYSANAGGHLASEQEGFGRGAFDVPYLRPAPYPTRDPNPWTVEIALADVGRRLGYRGELADVQAASVGPSGRVIELGLHGSGGSTTADAVGGRQLLGLRSNLFTVRLEQRATAPEAPPPVDGPEPADPVARAAAAAETAAGAEREAPDQIAAPQSRGAAHPAVWVAAALAAVVLGAILAIRFGRSPWGWHTARRSQKGEAA